MCERSIIEVREEHARVKVKEKEMRVRVGMVGVWLVGHWVLGFSFSS